MPKRACPFENDLLPQMKMHVGQKQVDTGVFREERMKDVYDRTLNLLREGVKALSNKLNSSAHMDPMGLPSPKPLSPSKLKSERNLKQMVLNSKLQLEITNSVISDNQLDLCGCCRVIDQSTLNKCYYCDQASCTSCLSNCAACSELFCQNCCLPVYDHEEHVMCLNCYEKRSKR